MHRTLALSLVGLAVAGATWLACAAEPTPAYSPRLAPASDEGHKALKRIRIPQGLRVDLFAAEPLLANPVAFCIDHKNRFYVAETFRLHAGVTDIRGHMDWLDDDLACRTVEDRIKMLQRRLGPKVGEYGREHDRVRLIEDTTGSGKADRSVVFADGFNHIEDGIGAGLVARGSDVWYTCIPDLWRLSDPKGTGRAEVRQQLQHGYGVHVGYLGHDLHGLCFGPDGRLYFSIGDRGLNVKTKEGTVASLDAGCVLRCNPDGSELEIFASGLRNPQELAFDDFGNLFTGDNNSDGGDQARWVYLVEGGDSGWRIGYQFGTALGRRGPFMAEDLWKPQWQGQAAYIVPPIANVANGPSGLACYPGVGLPDRYRAHFFLADFRGGSGGSGIHSFAVQPKGASFQLVDLHPFAWSVLATDVDFGTDCAVYFTDWVEGWGKPNKGRIYKIQDPERAKSPGVLKVKQLLAEGMTRRPTTEVAQHLAHPDRRVRQAAQFALAERGAEGERALTTVACGVKEPLMGRLHAIWGLGQVGRAKPKVLESLLPLLSDREAEVRAQAAHVLGDNRVAAASDGLVALLRAPEDRVRFFAATALGRLGRKEAIAPVLDMLRANGDKDPYLRHAGVMALAGVKDVPALLRAAPDASPAVRMGVLLALRRLGSPEVARFLDDSEPAVVLEAARAIYDTPIEAALPKLAALVRRPALPDLLGYRVLNANFRLGQAENATAVADFAARADASESLRLEALRELREWSKPAGRDRVMGLWRPLPTRPAGLAAEAIRPRLGGLFNGSAKVRQEAAGVAAALGIKEVGPALFAMLRESRWPAQVRVESLRALAALRDGRLDEGVRLALADTEPRLRNEGRRLLARSKPTEALPLLEAALESAQMLERQGAFATLGEMKEPGAEALLVKWLDRLLAGQVATEARLDLLEAAGKHAAAAIKARLTRYEASRKKGDPLAAYGEALVGGDAETGRRIFFQKAEVSCLRCHKVQGVGGEVGPDLTGIGGRQKRDYLLESIVEPNRQIAKGFETILLTLTDGQTRSGVLKSEDAREVRLMTAEGKLLVVPRDQIDERQTGKSAMPEDVVKHLSRSEVRDLVEFLAGLK
jgi:quinoprotein glucose dehydrogenase